MFNGAVQEPRAGFCSSCHNSESLTHLECCMPKIREFQIHNKGTKPWLWGRTLGCRWEFLGLREVLECEYELKLFWRLQVDFESLFMSLSLWRTQWGSSASFYWVIPAFGARKLLENLLEGRKIIVCSNNESFAVRKTTQNIQISQIL